MVMILLSICLMSSELLVCFHIHMFVRDVIILSDLSNNTVQLQRLISSERSQVVIMSVDNSMNFDCGDICWCESLLIWD